MPRVARQPSPWGEGGTCGCDTPVSAAGASPRPTVGGRLVSRPYGQRVIRLSLRGRQPVAIRFSPDLLLGEKVGLRKQSRMWGKVTPGCGVGTSLALLIASQTQYTIPQSASLTAPFTQGSRGWVPVIMEYTAAGASPRPTARCARRAAREPPLRGGGHQPPKPTEPPLRVASQTQIPHTRRQMPPPSP